MLGLQYFSFQAVWSPMFLFATIAVIIGYYYITGPWQEKHYPMESQLSAGRKSLFVVAALLYYLANEGPLSLLGHISFTFHMVNMSLSYLIAPPLVLLAIPSYIWKLLFSKPFWQKLRFLMNPIFTLIFFNMSFSVYHVPFVHDYVMTNFTVHRLYYLLMLVAAFMMWWHVVHPVKEWKGISHVKKMAYIFANGILLTPACALIIFAPEPLYAIYNDPDIWVKAMGFCIPGDTSYLLEQFQGPQYFNAFSIIEDQQLGGIVMKLVQEFTYGLILAYVFRAWFKSEHRDNENETTEQLLEKLALERR